MKRVVLMVLFAVLAVTVGSFCARGKNSSASASTTSTSSASDSSELAGVLIEDVPHVRQKPDFCGEACAEMYLKKLGKNLGQDDVYNMSGLDPALGRGLYTADMAVALNRIGFRVGDVWIRLKDDEERLEKEFRALHADLVDGIPSIVCMHFDDSPDTTEHFRLILGYDAKKDEVIYHEPAEDNGAYRRMKRDEFLKLWPLGGDTNPTAIRLRLKAGKIKEEKKKDGKKKQGFTDADYAQHIMKLKKKVPGGFSIVLQKPFVVIGDESKKTVKQRAEGTVKWTVDRLKEKYFTKDPLDIIDIWLFKNKASYEKNTKKIFGDDPDTPYGYYSETHKALIMNIATGGGTLVHEIVHPFMAANFPQCPSWLNEGLGSLYEQCGEKDGQIWGYTNWRLSGLKEAIREDRVPSFKWLISTTENEFYTDKYGTNYAQARYLCYFLQLEGKLGTFYHKFYKNRKSDPTGYKTLKKILGEKGKDMEAFQKEWEEFVLKLVFKY